MCSQKLICLVEGSMYASWLADDSWAGFKFVVQTSNGQQGRHVTTTSQCSDGRT